jgi:hypothetical protein
MACVNQSEPCQQGGGRPLGPRAGTCSYVLVGCSVAPGFEFDDFTFLRDHPGADEAVRRLGVDLTAML